MKWPSRFGASSSSMGRGIIVGISLCVRPRTKTSGSRPGSCMITRAPIEDVWLFLLWDKVLIGIGAIVAFRVMSLR